MARRERFIVNIGPELKKVLDEHRQRIKEATWGVDESSDWEAGEIIAKKIRDNKL